MLDKTVVTINDYGTVKFKLREYIDARKISRYALARKVGSRFEVIDKWCEGKLAKIDADVLARLCYVLDCSVSDIIEYVPAPEKEDQ